MISHKMFITLAVILLLSFGSIAKGYEMYSDATEMCCDGVLTNPGVNRACCGNISFSTDEALCCRGQIVPLPEVNRFSYGCCFNSDFSNAVPFNSETHHCCEGVPLLKEDKFTNYGCFNGELYDDSKYMKCGQELVKNELDEGCCFNEVFNLTANICCFETAVSSGHHVVSAHHIWPKIDNHKCCGSQFYDAAGQVCCGSNVVPKPAYLDKETFGMCCGHQHVVDPQSEICCRGNLYNRTSINNNCCGDLLYDSSIEICCRHHVFRKDTGKKCCWPSGKSYDPEMELCCHSEIVPRSLMNTTTEKTSCCAINKFPVPYTI